MTKHWPCAVVSTVVRGSLEGEGHGALHVVDLEFDESRELFRWDETEISWIGRGGDRGLRGVVVLHDRVLVAASQCLIELDPDGTERARHRNPYLGLAHEMTVHKGVVYVVSTAFDSILGFDPGQRRFVWGMCIRGEDGPQAQVFDPNSTAGPQRGDTAHFNQVHGNSAGLWMSALRRHWLVQLQDGCLLGEDSLPLGTHNARRLDDGRLLFNDTRSDTVVLRGEDAAVRIAVPRRPLRELKSSVVANPKLARPGFARGLLWLGEDRAIGGFSPAGVAGYDFSTGMAGPVHWLSAEVSHAVHGIARWPFDG